MEVARDNRNVLTSEMANVQRAERAADSASCESVASVAGGHPHNDTPESGDFIRNTSCTGALVRAEHAADSASRESVASVAGGHPHNDTPKSGEAILIFKDDWLRKILTGEKTMDRGQDKPDDR